MPQASYRSIHRAEVGGEGTHPFHFPGLVLTSEPRDNPRETASPIP